MAVMLCHMLQLVHEWVGIGMCTPAFYTNFRGPSYTWGWNSSVTARLRANPSDEMAHTALVGCDAMMQARSCLRPLTKNLGSSLVTTRARVRLSESKRCPHLSCSALAPHLHTHPHQHHPHDVPREQRTHTQPTPPGAAGYLAPVCLYAYSTHPNTAAICCRRSRVRVGMERCGEGSKRNGHDTKHETSSHLWSCPPC